MRHFLFATLIAAALLSPGVIITMQSTPAGLFFVVSSDAPRHLYVQVDGEGGAQIGSSSYYEYDIGAGELFGRRIDAFGPGAVRVRVWTAGASSEIPIADTTFPLPTFHTYLPCIR